MKYWTVLCLLLCNLSEFAIFAYGNEQNERIDVQVVAVFATRPSSNHHKPWASPNFESVRGSGFFFEDEANFAGEKGLILTNAHVVAMASTIMISNGLEKRRYNVHSIGICNLADFAVLRMATDELAEYEKCNGKVVPLELGDSDRLRTGQKVMGWGYPLGGERISKSEEGDINRIELTPYSHTDENWLTVQTSLQLNPGNSGGPIIKDGKVVGVAFQGMRSRDRINYFIPINLVKRLFGVLKNQERIPRWQYVAQEMSPQLRSHFGLESEVGGLLLNNVIPGGGPYKFGLRANDILLEIDGHKIDNFGEILFEPLGQKIHFEEVLHRKKVGDRLTMKVMRKKEILELTRSIPQGIPKLVPKTFGDANYFICGGVAFVELTQDCLRRMAYSGLDELPLLRYAEALPERPYQKIVIILEIFPEYGLIHRESHLAKRIKKVSGEEILNIRDLIDSIQVMKKSGKRTVLLEMSDNTLLALDLERADAIDRQLMEKYGILHLKTPNDFS